MDLAPVLESRRSRPTLGATGSFLFGFLVPFAIIGVGVWLVFAPPAWLVAMIQSFAGAEPKAAWYISRASGFAGLVCLWLSMVFGLIITNRLARLWPGGPAAVDLHEYTSLLALGFTALHVLVLLGDRYIAYSLPQLLVPFLGDYRPAWVALGQVGLSLSILATVTFYSRRRIGYRAFRLIHLGSFAAFVLVIGHGLLSGTDGGLTLTRLLYAAAGGSVVLLTIVRIARASAVGNRAPDGRDLAAG